ncbi:YeeE/YedE thiosulfate transporter family protein [uncultured Nitratireductor sp.]|uniref:YeeE/YedE family protein n=1 Tax=uncultured Nitratireductor sp. TaxID=520953 RepID=UPI0025D2492A|nr:YeeE/YedE thiosulfate transporter family protein [uncultured Nitratireductor sp.]
MTEFTPIASLAGGALIGLAAVVLMAFNGRIAGMTGILSGLLPPQENAWQWRTAFIAGAIVAPLLMVLGGAAIPFRVPVSTIALVAGGLLVGIGVTFGNGCPSGHGVCGISRGSIRSVVAVVTFMATAFAAVFIIRHVIGA